MLLEEFQKVQREAKLLCEAANKGGPSKCFYCGSLSYGKGCNYGPHKIHVHLNDPKKCIYCGSLSYGRGCRVNPFSDLHIHGIQFNTLIQEQLETNVCMENVLRKYLTESLHWHQAFRLGLIDADGNPLRDPVTEQERQSLGPLDKTLLRIRRYLGPKRDFLSLLPESEKLNESVSFPKAEVWEEKLRKDLDRLHQTIAEATQDGAPTEWILQQFR